MTQTPQLWKATYEADTPEKLIEAYKKWAPEYDADTTDAMGYVGPVVASQLLDTLLESRDSVVLDAGCGTGLVGEHLKKMGYGRVEAMDFSKEMLDVAECKDCYCKLYQADMNERLQAGDNTYDAVICVGTFTYAHVGPHAFEELVRVTKPEGYICFTVRDGAYQEYGYRSKMLDMEHQAAWELQQMVNENYLVKEEVTAKYCAYKVLC